MIYSGVDDIHNVLHEHVLRFDLVSDYLLILLS